MRSIELEKLKRHIDEKLESVQDLILVNESQCHSNIEIIGKNLSDMEDKMSTKLSSIGEKIGDLQINEHNKFEQVKRRCSDIAAMNANIHSRLESLIEPADGDSPHHLPYNNPFQNVHHEQQEEKRAHIPAPTLDLHKPA